MAAEHAVSEISTPPKVNDTLRTTKPGVKRLQLILSVLVFFIFTSPFLLKSIEIYRSPLPFREIDALSKDFESKPLLFLCHFHAVFLGFDNVASNPLRAEVISPELRGKLQKFTGNDPTCGSCRENFTLSVTLDSNSGCDLSQEGERRSLWPCGAISAERFEGSDDVNVDELLGNALKGFSNTVYTVVVVNGTEVVKAVIGEGRHAWILGRIEHIEEMLSMVAEIFFQVFVFGGKDGVIRPEFMPVGADGKVVFSFNLLNSDPRDWIYNWDFQMMEENFLAPVVEGLKDIVNISVESQVLYHTPKSSLSYWSGKWKSFIFSTKDLPFFVNSNEWHLDTSIAAGGRSKVLHFVVYIPSAKECPLLLELPSGEISETNGFISPLWGGIIVWNPPSCSSSKHSEISYVEIEKIFEVFLGQLRQLLGFRSGRDLVGLFGRYKLLSTPRAFSKWEIDLLTRQFTCFNLDSCSTTLGSLSRLVRSLPRMIVKDEIGKQVRLSITAAKRASSSATIGVSSLSSVFSREARALAEDAFFHPSIMSVSYYSFEHCFAIYSPFFLPVVLHVVLAAIREWRRYRQELRKYLAWKAKPSDTS